MHWILCHSTYQHEIQPGGPVFQLRMMYQSRAKLPQTGKAQIGISNQGRAIGIGIFRPRSNNGEGIISGGDTSLLNVTLQDIVDKTGLSGRVISNQQAERHGRVKVRRFWNGHSAESLVDGSQGIIQARAFLENFFWTVGGNFRLCRARA